MRRAGRSWRSARSADGEIRTAPRAGAAAHDGDCRAPARRRREREIAAVGSTNGASSTAASANRGASATSTSSRSEWPSSTETLDSVTPPRIVRASRLSSVCETIVPSTSGRVSRARPSRRETISAREGSPRRAGSVADMSTPMNVPCIASRRLALRHVGAAIRIACQASARTNIARHISPRPAAMRPGFEASSEAATRASPTRCRAKTRDRPREPSSSERGAAQAGPRGCA